MGSQWQLPLRLRLVASIGFIVLITVTGFGVTGYRAATLAARTAALTRLQSVAEQLAISGRPTALERFAAMERIAADPAVIRVLTDPASTASHPAAAAALARLGPDTGAVVATVIRDRLGNSVLYQSRPAPGRQALRPDSTLITPLFVGGDTIFFGTSAPIVTGSTLLGHVYQVRRLIGNKNLQNQVSALIGPQASVLVGNIDGSVWTDLSTVTARPPVDAGASEYSRNGVPLLAATAPIPSSPLLFAVELPTAVALRSARSLLRAFSVIGVVVLLLGIGVAWIVGGTIVGPLGMLTRASEQIAASGGAVPEGALPVDRPDEIGGLARSFAAMARRVREGRETLETEVAARTSDLSGALEQLEKAQEELVRKERLATLGQLAGSVGHELRNPLGVMTNAVYYLEITQRDAPEKVREYLGIIRNQVQISEKIVADLLDFARIRSPQRTTLNLAGFVEEQLARTALPPTVTVARHVDDDLSVVADPIQIGQVLLNVLTNAVQAMEQNPGTLIVRARAENDKVSLEVSDNGPGIEPDNIDQVFEPLFTTKARGIGLGLSVSRTLARANGGDLTVHSTPGSGATFTLDLPAR